MGYVVVNCNKVRHRKRFIVIVTLANKCCIFAKIPRKIKKTVNYYTAAVVVVVCILQRELRALMTTELKHNIQRLQTLKLLLRFSQLVYSRHEITGFFFRKLHKIANIENIR